MYYKRLLFFFDQYFATRLGENFYRYDEGKENLSFLRAGMAIARALLVQWRKKVKEELPSGSPKHLFYIETINQKNAVSGFLRKMNKQELLLILDGDINGVSLGLEAFEPVFLKKSGIYLNALLALPKVLWLAPGLARKYHRKVNRAHIYINLALFLSAVNFFTRLLDRQKPVSVTVVNDHNLFPLALIFASRTSNTTSIYIQHASVSDAFPKLLVNIALLEGQQAKDTYDKVGNFARKCLFVGIPRLDGYLGNQQRKQPGEKLVVGLCLKSFYTGDMLNNLIVNLGKSGRVGKIKLRPHPGSSAEFWEQLNGYDLEISDSRKENAVTFLNNVDVIVSGESTIVLEAALMKIPALYFDDGSFFFRFDLYGFVKQKIAFSHIRTGEELSTAIEDIDFRKVDEIFLNCQYYCSTVNTEFENRSSEIIVDFYRSLQ